MEWFKVLELFSRNWMYIVSLILLISLLKLFCHGYLQYKISELQHSKIVLHLECAQTGYRKKIEICGKVNLKDINKQLGTIDTIGNDKLLIPSKERVS